MKKTYILGSVFLFIGLSAFVYRNYSNGIDPKTIDTKTKPGNDFFTYVNGNWLKSNPIPAAEARWGSFIILSEQNNELLRKILTDAAAKQYDPGSNMQKIGDFWQIAMDTNKLEKDGILPATSEWNAINGITTRAELFKVLSDFHIRGIGGFYGSYVTQDIKNNERNMVYFSQGGLGLPDRDYYLKQDEKSKKIRGEYLLHLEAMFGMFGVNKEVAATNATSILALETGLAENSMSRVENRNQDKKYNPRSLADLKSTYPNIAWDIYFEHIGYKTKGVDTIILSQPLYFAYLNKVLETESIENLKTYMKWKLMASVSGYLTNALGKQNFHFYSTVITGTKEQKPRWKRVVGSANGLIGEIVAQEYVKVAFSEESKRKVNEMVDNLREAYRYRIENLEWMSAETKKKALEKLASFKRKLGYPDKWEDYSKLEIKKDSYLANYYRAQQFGHNQMLDKLGKPIDKTKWGMLPQTVNAYYSGVMNEIVFPAAIMQPPFFDAKADDAVNYGAIGAVIGHEFSHGFDDQGSKFDAKGNLNSWWTEEDRKKFMERTKVIVDQYSKFKVADSVYVNGELTQGENIADIAGLLVAYDAFQISLKGKERKIIDGYTPEQRFFIGFAQVWRGHARPEYVRNQVLTDPHSPQEFRVNGTLSNMPAFYKAFDVKEGDKLYRAEKDQVKIW